MSTDRDRRESRPGATREPAELVLRRGDELYHVGGAPVFVGRHPASTVHLETSRASRHHAVLYRAGDRMLVRDLRSTNGVLVNGERVKEEELQAGDRVTFADEEFEVDQRPDRCLPYLAGACATWLTLRNHRSQASASALVDLVEQIADLTLLHLGCPGQRTARGLVCAFGLWQLPDRRHSPPDSALAFALAAGELLDRELGHAIGPSACRWRIGIAHGPLHPRTDQGSFGLDGGAVKLAVNLAAAGDLYGAGIAMNGAFVERLRERAHVRHLDSVRFDGDGAHELFVFDDRARHLDTATTAVIQHEAVQLPYGYLAVYEAGLAQYRKREFPAALERFERANKVFDDGPARRMAERVQAIITGDETIPDRWDGTWHLGEPASVPVSGDDVGSLHRPARKEHP